MKSNSAPLYASGFWWLLMAFGIFQLFNQGKLSLHTTEYRNGGCAVHVNCSGPEWSERFGVKFTSKRLDLIDSMALVTLHTCAILGEILLLEIPWRNINTEDFFHTKIQHLISSEEFLDFFPIFRLSWRSILELGTRIYNYHRKQSANTYP